MVFLFKAHQESCPLFGQSLMRPAAQVKTNHADDDETEADDLQNSRGLPEPENANARNQRCSQRRPRRVGNADVDLLEREIEANQAKRVEEERQARRQQTREAIRKFEARGAGNFEENRQSHEGPAQRDSHRALQIQALAHGRAVLLVTAFTPASFLGAVQAPAGSGANSRWPTWHFVLARCWRLADRPAQFSLAFYAVANPRSRRLRLGRWLLSVSWRDRVPIAQASFEPAAIVPRWRL